MLRNELITKTIPKLMKREEKERPRTDTLEYQLLKQYEIKPPSGFARSSTQKTFYVNGHKHEEQKKHCSVFTTEYLSRLEPSSHRWIQIKKTRLEAIQEPLEEGANILQKGFTYTDPQSGTDMIEFHGDDHELLQQIANKKFVEIGSALSVRKPENVKPLIIFGQDESVYNQFAFNGI